MGLAALGQIARLAPALTKGPRIKLINKVSTTCKQFPLPVVVKNINTLPAVVSAVLGK